MPDAFTVAIAVLLLLHVPPEMVLLKVVDIAMHTLLAPEIADGAGVIVTWRVVWQPVASVYVILVLPAATPVTMPVAPTVAIDVLWLLHVPPPVPVNVVVVPTHVVATPPMAAGSGLTVRIPVRRQPVLSVYVITELPAVMPVATPLVPSIVAIDVFWLAHVPPVTVLLNDVVVPGQAFKVPEITAGSGLIVTTVVVVQPEPAV
jgi:hypothetical protein